MGDDDVTGECVGVAQLIGLPLGNEHKGLIDETVSQVAASNDGNPLRQEVICLDG